MFRRSIVLRNVPLRRLSTVDKGANKGPDSSSAMQGFMQGAAKRQEGASTPLWSRLVRDLTPPAKPESINVGAIKDRREFNRNKPVSNRQGGGGGQGRYGGAAPRRTGIKPAGSTGGVWRQGDDNSQDDDEAPADPTAKRATRFNEDGEEVDDYGEDDDEVEIDEQGRALRKSERELLLRVTSRAGYDENEEDIPDYKGIVGPSGQEDLHRHDFTLHYEEGAKSGGYLEKRAKDSELEFFMHNALWESYKTETGTYIDAWKLENHDRTRIPKPRSLKKLLFKQMPNIRHAGPIGSPGYVNAEAAWSVVHKNVYYSEKQKFAVVDAIGTKTNEVYAYINEGHLRNTEDAPSQAYDPVFRYGFKKGLRCIEEEEKEALLRESRRAATKKFVQGETDWSQEAADDEDSLK